MLSTKSTRPRYIWPVYSVIECFRCGSGRDHHRGASGWSLWRRGPQLILNRILSDSLKRLISSTAHESRPAVLKRMDWPLYHSQLAATVQKCAFSEFRNGREVEYLVKEISVHAIKQSGKAFRSGSLVLL